MDPRYRAVLVISLLLVFLWAVHVIWTVLLGSGLDPDSYIQGVMLIGGGVAAGYFVVWSAAALGNLRNNLKTGFEADVTDEFGTGFEMAGSDGKPSPFKLSLSKFLPQMVAPPSWPGLHPLEAELIGFLQGYRHWPVDLKAQNVKGEASGGKEFASLYEISIARWQVMRHLPGTGPWHRVAALAKDIALVHAYREIRTTHPLKHFWKRDQVRFVSRCQPHGGITAFVLSTFPGFRALKDTPEGQEIQRALLVALRYQETVHLLPLNSGALARELVDYLWRADSQLKQMDVRQMDQMTPEQLDELKDNIEQQWLGLLDELEPKDTFSQDVRCIKLADGSVWLRQDALLTDLAGRLKPQLRQSLGLWETGGLSLQHPSWPHISNILQDLGYVANVHDGQAAGHGCFTLFVSGLAWGPAVKIVLDMNKHIAIVRTWNNIQPIDETPEIAMDNSQLAAHAQSQAGQVDARLAELF